MSRQPASALSRAGAACLILGPLVGLVSVLVERSVSGKAADLAAAYTAHPDATRLGLALNCAACALTVLGMLWFAFASFRHTPRLAVTGGVLVLLGMLSVMVDNAFHLAGSIGVQGMDAAAATAGLHWLTSGGVVLAGVLSELADLGVILLAVSAVRLGVPRWGSAVIVVGVLAEGVGFAAGSRYLAAAGFLVAASGYTTVVRAVLGALPSARVGTAAGLAAHAGPTPAPAR